LSVTAAPTFPVELTAYEVRALANSAALLDKFVSDRDGDLFLPDGHLTPPLQSAQLKLEMALVLAGEER
jgi:tmRNA-binding protein